jgi:hypothetical protein
LGVLLSDVLQNKTLGTNSIEGARMSETGKLNQQLGVESHEVESHEVELIPKAAQRTTKIAWSFLAVAAVVTWIGYGKWSLLPIATSLFFGIRAGHIILRASAQRLEMLRNHAGTKSDSN